MELPKEFKGTVYFYWDTRYSWVTLSDTKFTGAPEYILLGKLDADVKFNVNRDDAVKKVVEALQDEKKNIQAKAQSDLKKLDEKINSLLAINYDGGE